MLPMDRAVIAKLVLSVENFNQAEVACALELIDVYLNDPDQTDYHLVVAEDSTAKVHGYACWGPVPLTKGTYDLYWIATHPDSRGQGYGRAIMAYVEGKELGKNGRLLAVETSAKESYKSTVKFYHRLGYEETSRIPDFYDVGDDKLTLVKRLS